MNLDSWGLKILTVSFLKNAFLKSKEKEVREREPQLTSFSILLPCLASYTSTWKFLFAKKHAFNDPT